jgi:putative ABC transport system permease protein
VPVEVQDPQTGAVVRLTVIGVYTDATPYELSAGLSVSQRALAPFGDRARPTIHYLSVVPGVDAAEVATRLERAFLANGMEAESIEDLMGRMIGGSRTFIRLMQGFMGLGLVIGVVALGVISARSVVERRQQLGVLRAIGFQPQMIRRTLLLESSFVALTAIVIGTALGLVMARNVVAETAKQPGWDNLVLDVPWVNLGIVFAVVYLAALAATLLSAVRASRVYPAEALRYR